METVGLAISIYQIFIIRLYDWYTVMGHKSGIKSDTFLVHFLDILIPEVVIEKMLLSIE